MSEDKAVFDLLKEEYFHLQSTIEKFDEKSLQIKGWSITVCLAGAIAATVSDELEAPERAVAYWICAAGSAAFWLIDAAWKDFQRRYFPRVAVIEKAFAQSKADSLAPLQISSQNFRRRGLAKAAKAYMTALILPHVLLPHVLIAAVCTALALNAL